MQRHGEYRAAEGLILIPEWAEDDGRCVTCRYAMCRPNAPKLRCDLHEVGVERDHSCMDYVPAPELKEARDFLARKSALWWVPSDTAP
jgi:hypothetical protein